METLNRRACSSPECPVGNPGRSLWRYCPWCGTRAEEVVVPTSFDPAVTDTGVIDVPLLGADVDAHVEATVVDGVGRSEGLVHTTYGPALRLNLSNLRDGESTQLIVETADATRTDLWDSRPRRRRPMRVVRRVPRFEIAVFPSVAIFLPDRTNVEVCLENRGNTTAMLAPPPPTSWL